MDEKSGGLGFLGGVWRFVGFGGVWWDEVQNLEFPRIGKNRGRNVAANHHPPPVYFFFRFSAFFQKSMPRSITFCLSSETDICFQHRSVFNFKLLSIPFLF